MRYVHIQVFKFNWRSRWRGWVKEMRSATLSGKTRQWGGIYIAVGMLMWFTCTYCNASQSHYSYIDTFVRTCTHVDIYKKKSNLLHVNFRRNLINSLRKTSFVRFHITQPQQYFKYFYNFVISFFLSSHLKDAR